ncbi:DUF5050 domain-containing protein [Pseudochryseolinea flava]|nr:DUF5050 domain-containing protein [Pseudochryseolinea flava]
MKSKIFAYLTLFMTLFIVISCDDDDSKPEAAATFDVSKTTVSIGEEIQFTNTSKNATAFKWSFGDGTTSKEVSPKKSYTSSGTFVVSLLSTGTGGSQIANVSVTVLPDPEIFFTEVNANMIRKFAIGSPTSIGDFLDVTEMAGVGLAYDAANEKVYFSDYAVTGEGKIWRVNLDGTDLEAIVDGLYDPYQIALDVENGKVYWAEDLDADEIGHIGRANLDGSDKEYVVSLDGGEFRAIALDTENDKMYYYEVYNEDLYQANLDGTDATPILSGVFGYALAVDMVNDKIYFDEQNDEELKRADLDGSNIETIDDNGSRIYGIAVDAANNKIYWSGRDSGVITTAALDGTHKRDLASGLFSPRGLFLKK